MHALKALKTGLEDRAMIQDLLEMHFQDAMSSIKHALTWRITPENIAELNVQLWTYLEPKLKFVLDSRLKGTEETLNNIFSTADRQTKEERESSTMERSDLFQYDLDF